MDNKTDRGQAPDTFNGQGPDEGKVRQAMLAVSTFQDEVLRALLAVRHPFLTLQAKLFWQVFESGMKIKDVNETTLATMSDEEVHRALVDAMKFRAFQECFRVVSSARKALENLRDEGSILSYSKALHALDDMLAKLVIICEKHGNPDDAGTYRSLREAMLEAGLFNLSNMLAKGASTAKGQSASRSRWGLQERMRETVWGWWKSGKYKTKSKLAEEAPQKLKSVIPELKPELKGLPECELERLLPEVETVYNWLVRRQRRQGKR